jgi:hypothetical protein
MITHMGLQRQPGYFGHAAPFHCFTGDYKGHVVSVVTNGKDRKYGCDNVSGSTVGGCCRGYGKKCDMASGAAAQVGTVPAAMATYLAVEVRCMLQASLQTPD